MTLARAFAVGLVALTATHCDFTAFSQYRTGTPVITIPEPMGYPGELYARAIAVVGDEMNTDWLIVSGGLGSPVVALQLRDGNMFAPATVPARYICGPENPCGTTARFGIALAGITGWQGATMCAASGAFGMTHQVHLGCLGATPTQTFDLMPPFLFRMAGFGLAMASPQRRHDDDPPTSDLVFVAAHAGPGAIFAVTPSGTTDVTPPGVDVNESLGDALAVGRIRLGGTNDLLLLAGGTGTQTVRVLRGDPRAGRAMQPIGCIRRSGETGFGGALAVGDIDGDGSDDVIVGASPDVVGRRDRVRVFLTSAIANSAACDAWPEAASLDCTDDATRGVSCGTQSGFGSTLASGDIDGDGRDEIIVGAPHALVDGVADAGAVWVLHGSAGTGGHVGLVTATVLRDGAASASHLGEAVLTARLGARTEVLATASGQSAVRLYLCTGIPGDTPNTGGLGSNCR